MSCDGVASRAFHRGVDHGGVPRWSTSVLVEELAAEVVELGVQPRYGQKPPSVDRGMSLYCLDEVSALVVKAVVEAEHREAVPT